MLTIEISANVPNRAGWCVVAKDGETQVAISSGWAECSDAEKAAEFARAVLKEPICKASFLEDDYWRRSSHEDRGLRQDEKDAMTAREKREYERCSVAYGGEPSTAQWQKWRAQTIKD
ncbi:MAG: hypothetical protein KGL39_06325 [Patescibacteria group bacterium]|nr:hypothetical protein [Patescibacteria group bacterium]